MRVLPLGIAGRVYLSLLPTFFLFLCSGYFYYVAMCDFCDLCARAKTLDIKTHKGWKYDVREETGNEIIRCFYFGQAISTKPKHYDMFYGDIVSDMILVATLMIKKLKTRQSIFSKIFSFLVVPYVCLASGKKAFRS